MAALFVDQTEIEMENRSERIDGYCLFDERHGRVVVAGLMGEASQ